MGFSKRASAIFGDIGSDGLPLKPSKAEIRAWGGEIEDELAALQAFDLSASDPASLVAERPGDAPGTFTDIANLDALPAVAPGFAGAGGVGASGAVRVLAGTSGLATRRMWAIEPGRVYLARWVVRRRANSPDPSNDTLRVGLRWFDQVKAALSSVTVQDLTTFSTGSGRTVVDAVIARTAGTGIDFVAPLTAVYVRLFVQSFGTGAETDVEVVHLTDITDVDTYSPDLTALTADVNSLVSINAGDRLDDLETQVSNPTIRYFSTVATAAAATIPGTVDSLHLFGRATAGDGAGGDYRRVVSLTAGAQGFTTADGAHWQRVHETVGYIDVLRDYFASGSITATTGGISASSTTLTLAAAIDFENGQGISIAGAGETLNAVSGLGVTAQGTTGATPFTYTVVPYGVAGSLGAPVAAVTVANGTDGNLSGTNFNRVAWTAPAGTAPAGYAIYGRKGNVMQFLANVGAGVTQWDDTAATYATPPAFVPAALPTAAVNAFVTTIVSGGGSTTLTLATAAKTTVAGAAVNHDDGPAFRAAFAALGPKGGIVRHAGKHRFATSLNIPPNCGLQGPYNAPVGIMSHLDAPVPVVFQNPYANLSALVVASTASIVMQSSASLIGSFVYRAGMTFPEFEASFAGTAIVAAGGDNLISNCTVMGFTKMYLSQGFERLRMSDVQFDCSNGVDVQYALDIPRMTRVHGFPFVTYGAPGGTALNLARVLNGGRAFSFSNVGDGNKITDCFAYGYLQAFVVSDCNSLTFLGCWSDNLMNGTSQVNTNAIGFLIAGASTETRLIACQASAAWVGFFLATSAGLMTHMLGCNAWACYDRCIEVDSGDFEILGGKFRTSPAAVHLASAASRGTIRIATSDITGGGTPIFANVANISKVTIDPLCDWGDWPVNTNPVSGPGAVTLGVQQVASATSLPLPARGDLFEVTGSAAIGNLPLAIPGRRVILYFTGTATLTHSTGFIRMKDGTDWAPTSTDITIELVCVNGVLWIQV